MASDPDQKNICFMGSESRCGHVLMNAEILETIKATKLGLCMKILEIREQHGSKCHAHSTAHNAKVCLAPTILKIFFQ